MNADIFLPGFADLAPAASAPAGPPEWREGTVDLHLVNSHGERVVRPTPASILDGLAVHVVHWDSPESPEPRYTLSFAATGDPIAPHYLEYKRGKAGAKAMAARVVALPEWVTLRAYDGTNMTPAIREAAGAINYRMGEWLDWPYGWPKPAPPYVEPSTTAEAAARYAAARRSFLMLAWYSAELAPGLRRDVATTGRSLARLLGPANFIDHDGRRFETGPDGELLPELTGAIGGYIPREAAR